MTYKELVLTVRPGAVEKMGGIINKNRRVIGHNWQSAFEALLPAEQAEARVRQVYPDAVEKMGGIIDENRRVIGHNWLDAEKNLKGKKIA